ncbi:type II toxin-antitoxin system tRNA(fMet)-specific endonuclease VapC [Candidatus Electronema sp. TJ]|uniref:type II toxin-antitoxin system tRNA(fMet)-specific endonuclease VapC n=1 Tax=Candidatus Electronema sp. TJ TaxID=3401573 RepID=UPI003AA9565B
MIYLLDTCICIYLINKRPPSLISNFKQHQPGEIGISVITASELQYGVAISSRKKENQERLDVFLAPFDILPYDAKAVAAYGGIRAELEKKGQPIGPLDMLIAAQALSGGLILVTNNEKEFQRIPGLKIENWAA